MLLIKLTSGKDNFHEICPPIYLRWLCACRLAGIPCEVTVNPVLVAVMLCMYYHGPWCTLPIICCAVWWFLMEKDPLFFWSISMLCSKLACHADKGFFFIRTYTCLKKKICAVDSCGRLWLAWPVINTLKKKSPPVSLVTFATWSIVVFPSPAGITKIARPAW